MKKISYPKSFYSYLKTKVSTLLCLFSISSIFALLFVLRHYDLDIILYGTLLSFIIVMFILGIDFYYYHRKYSTLYQMENHIDVTIDDLPKAIGTIEEQYQLLLFTLFNKMQDNTFKSDNQYQDVLDYYTMWAHQIKTPIAAMKLLLQVENSSQHDMALELLKIEQYVEMVLHYLRMQTMSNDLVLTRYSLDTIVRDCIKKQSHFFIRKNIHLQLDSLDITVLTDEKWLSFVIEQVLSNALKYTSENGNIHIYLQTPSTLVIQDDGTGIRKEDLPRVFEKGFTGCNGRIDKLSTGIGLYLCKQIIDKLSHTITIDSIDHQGTSIYINLETKETLYD